MRYTDEIIEEVRARNDIVDIISPYVKLTRRGSSYFGLCPFHNEKTASFSVSPGKQMYYCFGCGAGGNVITFLMQYENYTFQEALKVLADRAGVKLPESEMSREAREEADRRTLLLEINRQAALYYVGKLHTPAGARAMEYLQGRALSADTIRSFGLGYADRYSNDLYQYMKQKGYPDDLLADSGLFLFDEKRGASDKFWNRVMFPIMDANSRVIGFGGRVMGDGKPKYLNSPETKIFDKSRNLYGLHAARRSKRKNLIICEGYMAVIAMHQAGYSNAVASLGTALTSQQCSLLSRFTGEVLVIYDMDDAGVRAALRAIPMLRESGLSARVVDLRPYKDPDEFIRNMGPEAFEERLENAENSFLFTVRMSESGYDLHDPQGKTDFLHETAARLAEISDEIERNSYTEAIARKYRIDRDLLTRQIGKQAMKGTAGKVPQQPRRLSPEKAKRDTAADKSQKLMLTWLTDMPELIAGLSDWLSPSDFTNPLYREAAELIWKQAESGKVSPASVINHFTDSELQTQVAALFNTNIDLPSEDDRKKALTDVLLRMKQASLDARAAALDPADMQGMLRLTEQKKQLEKLRETGLPPHLFEPQSIQ